ncbi:MAG: S1 family peptidase [Chloroflexota bacterium]|nr:S1 family peptidase [Chloroflexota bacterium]
MPTYAETLAALPAFRNEVARRQQSEPADARGTVAVRGAFSALATPLSNIHATGVGIRQRGGRYVPEEVVLKLFVFDKVEAEALGEPPVGATWRGFPVDVEPLPVQLALEGVRGAQTVAAPAVPLEAPVEEVPPYRQRQRPIVGGLSISPINVQYVGTLGCFVSRSGLDGGEEVFALSNNHVLADVDRLPLGTPIVQPGPEQSPATPPEDVFAALSAVIPLRFPTGLDVAPVNEFDAAIALVTDRALIQTGVIFGGVPYAPSRVVPPVPGMRVVKAGRTTGITRGLVTATNVDGVQVNYGTYQAPRLAVFNETIEIASPDEDTPFSMPGDSGSVVVEEATGHPVALLFAGDGRHTTTCDLGALCRQLRAWPV